MKEFGKLLEAFAIRVLWMFHATRLKRTPGLCPPACQEGHTYRWPCRARISHFQRLHYAQASKYAHYAPIETIKYSGDSKVEATFHGFETIEDVPTGDFRDMTIREVAITTDEGFPGSSIRLKDSHQIQKCDKTRAGGWGQVAAICVFEKGHDGAHSWVVN